MRIVTGKFKGMEIASPSKNLELRPTTDRVREAIFDVIRFKITDAVFLDLFAGSGAMGIEAISEGAKFSFFVERNSLAIKTIYSNIKRFKIANQTSVIKQDVLRFLQAYKSPGVLRDNYDIVFLDPPYTSKLATQTMMLLSDFPAFNKEAIIIAEHSPDEPLKDSYTGKTKLAKFKEKEYGDIVVSYYLVNP